MELSGQQSTAHLTAAFGLVLDAQLCGDRAAWVTFEQSAFFPPPMLRRAAWMSSRCRSCASPTPLPQGELLNISCAPVDSGSW